MQHVFVVGAKSFGMYGGYETFINKLTEYHQDVQELKYHVACKANGDGCMDESVLQGVQRLSDTEFIYHNAHCFKIKVPDVGPAQAVLYDIWALQYCCDYIKKHAIKNPIVYVLACRIGPVGAYFHKKINRLGGRMYINPDGHEWMRAKWPKPIRAYWKFSEKMMVKHADLVICDSMLIEKYIQQTYQAYHPNTTYISYGAEMRKSILSDDDPKLFKWYAEKGLRAKEYYLAVGRFVPENNYETMLREFMKSKTNKHFAIIINANEAFLNKLEQKLHLTEDARIKFVGTVYDQELLMKIRENAYGYLHGHEVGGTNPSLLEALGTTDLNLLLNVGFNEEVARDAALYWTKESGNLCALLDRAETLSDGERAALGEKAKNRVAEAYSWNYISDQYAREFLQLRG